MLQNGRWVCRKGSFEKNLSTIMVDRYNLQIVSIFQACIYYLNMDALLTVLHIWIWWFTNDILLKIYVYKFDFADKYHHILMEMYCYIYIKKCVSNISNKNWKQLENVEQSNMFQVKWAKQFDF